MERSFEKLGIQNIITQYSKKKQRELFIKLESGLITDEMFYNELKKLTPAKVSDEELNNAWNSIILKTEKERVNLLYKLKDHYRLFLFSNTSRIHVEYNKNQLMKDYGKNILEEIFEKKYYSFEMHIRKPDPDAFIHVLNDKKLNAKETLFIDDNKENTDAADNLGICSIHLKKPLTILDIFEEWPELN
jgi:putative hydrolase of the HAD superfamily